MIILIVLHYVLIHRNFIQLQTQCVTHPDYPIIQLFVFESYRRNRACEAARTTKSSSRKHSGQAEERWKSAESEKAKESGHGLDSCEREENEDS